MLSFEELKRLVEHTTRRGGPHFYRSHYKLSQDESARSIRTMDQWQALPHFTKDDLLKIPLEERSFLPLSQLDHLRASSGTSGKAVLFSPRTHVRNMTYRREYHDFEGAFLAFTVPMMPHWHELFLKEIGKKPRVVAYDPKNPAASVRLAKAAGVTGISTFVFHYPTICEHMVREGMNHQIRLVEMAGDLCSLEQYKQLRATFANATIVQSYGSSEVEDTHIGMPCKPMTGEELLAVYHAKDTHYLEILDPATGHTMTPFAGAEGDLLITSYPGEPCAMPLIRFRIGDTVRVVEEECMHGSWSFVVLGRTELDFIKVPGGILRADEVARVLKLFPDHVSDRFELHATEEETASGPKLKARLYVELKKEVDLAELATFISERLRIGPSTTYADGVLLKRLLPLTCDKLVVKTNQKGKRIVRY